MQLAIARFILERRGPLSNDCTQAFYDWEREIDKGREVEKPKANNDS